MASTRAKPTLPLLLALVVVIPGPGDSQVSIHPPKAFLPRGGSLQVNCSSSCENPSLGLETQWLKDELESGPSWKLFELSDIGDDSSPMCYDNCGTTQYSASAMITVYSFPEHVELDRLPVWQQVGKNLTLRCRVYGGAPRTQLSAVLLRGEETLSRQPVGGDPKYPKEITFTVLASRGDHGANFSCLTELDLRPQGLALFSNVSEVRQLRTFDLPATNPKLDTPDLLEVGTQQRLLCSLEGLFPAPEAQIYLELGGRMLTQESTNSRDFVSATALVEVTEEFDRTMPLRCVLKLADQTLETQRTLRIYNFSAPVLTLSQLEVSEGSQVTVKCEAHGGAQVVHLSGVPPGPPTPQVQFTLNASPEDHKRRFFCSAVLEVAGKFLSKNQTLELHVLYGPRLDERDCLGNWTWQEGSRQTLKCQASGNPSPKLICSRKADGALLPIGVVESVKREMNGTYKCHAFSSHGNVTRDVTLIVLYHHQNNWAIIIVLVLVPVVLVISVAIYIYNHQRKIRIYKLQKAQEEAMRLKAQAPPP
ncbi:intercellular adhesion molecule 1 [Arvicanthis niloticus]|uniref:intercellular adhesion molecule 1 n=1 Tax=Arvicanthis niloticus TaxID=61156 RepID=UPI001486525E|nr:intercellular adhesion molecule 1 [Arvicanthis niloticus]